MGTMMQDLRYAARNLVKRPGFTAVAVLCLGLGIGANTAAFSFIDAFFLHKLPVDRPEQLVRIYNSYNSGFAYGELSYPEIADYKVKTDVFTDLIGESFLPISLRTQNGNVRIYGSMVTGNYFDVLGVKPILGRTFLPEEDRVPGAHPVVVVSSGMWQRRYASDPGLLGRTISLSGHAFAVIGIAPSSFTGTMVGLAPEVWVPTMMRGELAAGESWLTSRKVRELFTLGRLKPGATLTHAGVELNVLQKQFKQAYPDDFKTAVGVTVLPERAGGLFPEFRGPFIAFLGILMAVAGLVLLIACANVGGLLIARAAERQREMGIRQAIGASRGRLLRQLLTESVLLGLLAGAAGVFIAYATGKLVLSFTPPTDFPLSFKTQLDGYLLSFAALVSLLSVLAFGLAPALQASRPDLVRSVRADPASKSFGRSRLRNLLVTGQVAASLVLLICAGLFVRSLQNATSIDLGFDPQNVAVASVDVSLHQYDETRGTNFFKQVLERLRGLPGVKSTSLVAKTPFMLEPMRTRINPDGFQLPASGLLPLCDYNVVDPGYFATVGMPLLRGRDFRDSDSATGSRVAIVNETLAKKYWPHQDPVGKHLVVLKEPREVVGVAKNSKYMTLGEQPIPFVYVPFRQNYTPEMAILVRSANNSQGMFEPLRQAVRSLDAELIVFDVMPMRDRLKVALLPAKLGAGVLGVFGLLALLLAAIGLYGVLAYSVSQRTREIGIRMALGATGSRVQTLVVGQGLRLIFTGIAGGLGLAFATSRLLSSVLYGVSATDPLAFFGTTSTLILVSLGACFLPARRATRLDPMTAIRYE